ncbi:MAG: putative selenoprotein [Rhodospirillales bacterium]|nr:putative selenoprotein [Rhodospirillales bacterium]
MRDIAASWRRVCRAARQVFAIPDYDAYLEHCRAHHPDAPVLSRADFFRHRIDHRYGGGGGMRCC